MAELSSGEPSKWRWNSLRIGVVTGARRCRDFGGRNFLKEPNAYSNRGLSKASVLKSMNLHIERRAPKDVLATPWDTEPVSKRYAVNASKRRLEGGQRKSTGIELDSQNSSYRRCARPQFLCVETLLDSTSKFIAVSSNPGALEKGA
jgi:hypothetical protein